MAIEYFCCYHSYRKKLADLTDEQVGRIIRAAMLYSESGEIAELSPIESIAFNFIRFDIDQAHKEYKRKCEVNRVNASRRNRPQATTNDGNQSKTETKAKTESKTKTEDNHSSPSEPVVPEVDVVFDLYNKLCPSLREVRSCTDRRREAVRELLKRHTIEEITEAFRAAEKNEFLRGGGERGWVASFDWLTQEKNFVGVLEGNYEEWHSDRGRRDTPIEYTDSGFFEGL